MFSEQDFFSDFLAMSVDNIRRKYTKEQIQVNCDAFAKLEEKSTALQVATSVLVGRKIGGDMAIASAMPKTMKAKPSTGQSKAMNKV